MADTARVLLVASLLAALGLTVFTRRLVRIEPAEPQRLIGELRFSQWMAVLLAATGGAWLGLAAARPVAQPGGVEAVLGIATLVLAAWTLQRDTRGALATLCAAFLIHAIIDTAHRPGWLDENLAPRWFALGCAAFNLWLSALCFVALRRRDRAPNRHVD